MSTKASRYDQIIECVFASHYQTGAVEVTFNRDELATVADKLQIKLPKNLGDVVYTYRYRRALPNAIRSTAPEGFEWIIRPAGRSVYTFALTRSAVIVPAAYVLQTKIPDATPGIIAMYALSDEQALLAKLRYNRQKQLLDNVFQQLAGRLQAEIMQQMPPGRLQAQVSQATWSDLQPWP